MLSTFLTHFFVQLNEVILPLLKKVIEPKQFLHPEKSPRLRVRDCAPMKQLLEFLDRQMEICSDNLLPATMLTFLKLLWETIMEVGVVSHTAACPSSSVSSGDLLLTVAGERILWS